ncbi:hypothetical protein Pfo_008621 [Paulownia fortunei]|nr:hypothetical protein Pfo_008621 [Paulownia fortunei]
MEKKCADERWALANSAENAVEFPEDGGGEEEENDEEALSLSDLPLIHQWRKEKEEEEESSLPRETETQEDFDFCSLSKESEMCAADEVFFQGQILPLRHSVSSEKGLLQYCYSRNASRSISRSESMDHYCSGGLISSRSSSISSHQSSSSGSSTVTMGPKYKPKLPPRNQFHSHPSPSPKIRFPSNRQGMISTNHRNCSKKSSVWNIFRLGLVTTPPEIAFQDLKTRCPINNTNGKNFGSRNSTSSNSSSISSSNSNKKKKPRALLGGCKCSVDAVDTIASRVVIIKRSASESDVEALEQENVEAMKPPKMTKKQAAKKHLSHNRTFEWLKQLSLEGAADEA